MNKTYKPRRNAHLCYCHWSFNRHANRIKNRNFKQQKRKCPISHFQLTPPNLFFHKRRIIKNICETLVTKMKTAKKKIGIWRKETDRSNQPTAKFPLHLTNHWMLPIYSPQPRSNPLPQKEDFPAVQEDQTWPCQGEKQGYSESSRDDTEHRLGL